MSQFEHRSGNSVCHEDSVPQPNFEGFQLIGDRQLLRFAEQFLHKYRRWDDDGLAFVGLCVQEQSMSHLLSRLRRESGSVSKKVILMIGTNDVMAFNDENRMVQDIQDLVCKLMEDVQTLIIVTLPPVPVLSLCVSHWKRLRKLNNKIRSMDNGDNIFVVDAYPEFVWLVKRSYVIHTFGEKDSLSQVDDGIPDEIRDNYFERFTSKYSRHRDETHLNNKGLCIIKQLLSKKIRSLTRE